jgi:hypothetical protein
VSSYVGQDLSLVAHVVNLLQFDDCGRLVLISGFAPRPLDKPALGLAQYLESIHPAAVGLGAVGWPDKANAGKGPWPSV